MSQCIERRKAFAQPCAFAREDRPILYLGHSGYYEDLAPQAIAAVAANAAALDRAITGIIPGFTAHASSHVYLVALIGQPTMHRRLSFQS